MQEPDITISAHIKAPTAQPRTIGAAKVSVKTRDGNSVLEKLHQKGSLKLLFPRGRGTALTGVLLNTAGGVTGGDRFDFAASVAPGGHLTLTTQAAERAYCAQTGETGRLSNRITLAAGARCDWLPQETILFNGAALRRRLTVDMELDSHALIVEPVILGRTAMGERLHDVEFADRVDLIRDGTLMFADRTRLSGDAVKQLRGTATGADSGAMASILLAAQDAERFLAPTRALMPKTGGVSMVRDGLLFARVLAPDGFALRQFLIPLIRQLGVSTLPRTWMI